MILDIRLEIYIGSEIKRSDLTSQQSSVSTEKQQTESSLGTMNPSRKRKASEIDFFYFDISPKKRRLDTRKMKTTIRRKTGTKVSKGAKIRNRYNQVPHLTQDTNGKVTNSQKTPQTRAKRSALSQQVTSKNI